MAGAYDLAYRANCELAAFRAALQFIQEHAGPDLEEAIELARDFASRVLEQRAVSEARRNGRAYGMNDEATAVLSPAASEVQ